MIYRIIKTISGFKTIIQGYKVSFNFYTILRNFKIVKKYLIFAYYNKLLFKRT